MGVGLYLRMLLLFLVSSRKLKGLSYSEEFVEDAELGGAVSDDVAAGDYAEDFVFFDDGEGFDGLGCHDLGCFVDGCVGVDGDEGVGHDVFGFDDGGVVAGLHDLLEYVAFGDDADGSAAVDDDD